MPYVVFAFFGFIVGRTWPMWTGTFIVLGAVMSVVVALWVDVNKGESSDFFRAYAEALVYRGYLPGAAGLLLGALAAVYR